MANLDEFLALFNEHERNREWFEKNREILAEKYDGKFIAIYEQAVIDFDEDVGRLMERVEKKYPPDKVFVEYISKEKLQLIL
ncbi:MAG: DUF5678 domain-containing protein [Thermoproteota archaeon]